MTLENFSTNENTENQVEEIMKKFLEKDPKVGVWSYPSYLLLQYLYMTVPSFKMSKVAKDALEKGLKEIYPELFSVAEKVAKDANKTSNNIGGQWNKEIIQNYSFMLNETKIINYSKKSKDILEAVIATVFENIGFKVSIDSKLKSKHDGYIEVDVWGQKNVLKVYVSCKNYNNPKKMGTDEIHEEIGRVEQLSEEPTIKIIVASEFTDQARKIAEKKGFIPIGVGFKINENNIYDAYIKIYNEIKNIFFISS